MWMKDFTSPVYAFYGQTPNIEYVNGRKCHVFSCKGRSCKHTIRRYLDTTDAKSTGNMVKHARKCWGEDSVNQVLQIVKNARDAREGPVKSLLETGTITSAFQHTGKGKVTYSHRELTRTETK